MNTLSKFGLPQIHTVGFTYCGNYLESVRRVLNNSLPYSIKDLIVGCNEIAVQDMRSTVAHISDMEHKSEFDDEELGNQNLAHTIPSDEFIQDLWEAIETKVEEKVVITGLQLTCKQF